MKFNLNARRIVTQIATPDQLHIEHPLVATLVLLVAADPPGSVADNQSALSGQLLLLQTGFHLDGVVVVEFVGELAVGGYLCLGELGAAEGASEHMGGEDGSETRLAVGVAAGVEAERLVEDVEADRAFMVGVDFRLLFF